MTSGLQSSTYRGSPSSRLFIEEVCDRFEADLRRGCPAPIANYTCGAARSAETIDALIGNLLLIQWDFQREQATPPTIDDYLAQELIPAPRLQRLFSQWQDSSREKQIFASFELIERVGEGRFGTVWKAHDASLDRVVAVKIAHPSLIDDTDQFLREARIACRLSHPNIASAISAGQWKHRPYIVREFIEGETLAHRMRHSSYSHTESAALCLELAGVLSYSHAMGCVHRDLKPGNVLIDPSGRIVVIDFGLAKSLDSASAATRSGAVLGTPVYMAPEQARGDSHRADARTDIYSLGVILYELLTGRVPFTGNFETTLLQVLNKQPPDPRKADSSVPSSLAAICLKCLQKDPNLRYPTAADLADDLGRFVAGGRVRATGIGQIRRTWRFAKANPLISTLCACIFLLLCATSIYALHSERRMRRLWQEESLLRAAAVIARQEAEDAAEKARVESQLASEVTTFLENVFSTSDPIGTRLYGAARLGDPNISAVDLLDRAAERLDKELVSQPRLRARLLDIVGGVNCNLGRFEESKRLFREARQVRDQLKAEFPHRDFRRDEAMHLLVQGRLNQFSGDYAQAQQDYESCLSIYQDVLPEDDLQIAEVMFQIGWLHIDRRKPEEAEPCFDHCIRIRRSALPEDHQLVLVSELARAHCRGDMSGFRTWGLHAAKTLGDPEVGLLAFTVVQTQIMKETGQYERAIPLHKRILDGVQRRFTKASPLYLLALGDYAGTLTDMGDYKNAYPTILPAIKAGEAIAPGHPHLIRAYRTIGYEMFLARRYAEAESSLLKVVADSSVTPLRRRDTQMWLVENDLARKEFHRARKMFESIDRTGITIDSDAWYQHLSGRIRQGLGDPAKATQLFRRAKALAEKCDVLHLPPTVVDNLARIYESVGDDAAVERLLRQAFEREQETRPDKHPRLSDRMQRLGGLLVRTDRPGEAIPLLEKALEIRQLRLPEDDIRIEETRALLHKAKLSSGTR